MDAELGAEGRGTGRPARSGAGESGPFPAASAPGLGRPAEPPVPEAVLEAIATADQVVIGPGSLFTSVLAVCAVPGIRDALAARSGGRVYVCNVGLQIGETGGFDADDHMAALADHGVVVDAVVCDPAAPVGALSRGAGRSRAWQPSWRRRRCWRPMATPTTRAGWRRCWRAWPAQRPGTPEWTKSCMVRDQVLGRPVSGVT